MKRQKSDPECIPVPDSFVNPEGSPEKNKSCLEPVKKIKRCGAICILMSVPTITFCYITREIYKKQIEKYIGKEIRYL